MKIKDITEARGRPAAKKAAPVVTPTVPLPAPIEKLVQKFANDPEALAYARTYAEWKVTQKGYRPDNYSIASALRRRIINNIDLGFQRIKHLSNIGQDSSKEVEARDLPEALQLFQQDLKALGFTKVQMNKYTRRDPTRNIAEIWLCLDGKKMNTGKGVFKWHPFENMIKDGGWKDAHGVAIGMGLLADHYYTKKLGYYNFIVRVAGSPMTYQDWDGDGGALKIWLKMPTYADL